MLSSVIRQWLLTVSLDDVAKIAKQAAEVSIERLKKQDFVCVHMYPINCPECADALNIAIANIG